MQILSAAAATALADGEATYRPRVDLYRGGNPVAGGADLPLDEANPGAVQIDDTAAVLRTVTLNFAPTDDGDLALVPLIGGPLEPSGAEARVFMDLGLPDGTTFVVPMGRFLVHRDEASDAASPVVTVTGRDYAQRIIDAQLIGPYDVVAGSNGATAIHDLIAAGVSGLTYVGFQADATLFITGDLHFADGDDRWARAAEMAQSIGKRVRIAVDGSVVLADIPDASTQAPAWTYDESATSLMSAVDQVVDRDGAASHAIVIGQPGGNQPNVRSEAFDLDPASPTYYPAFGDKQVRLTTGLVSTAAQADAAVAALLAANRGLVETVQVTAGPVPALEDGDVVRVRRAGLGIDRTYILSRFPQPLGPQPQALTMRARRVA